MTDEELIGYCDFHSETPRALFHSEQVLRMIKLANAYPWYCDIDPDNSNDLLNWISLHEEMKNLVDLARGNLYTELIIFSNGEQL